MPISKLTQIDIGFLRQQHGNLFGGRQSWKLGCPNRCREYNGVPSSRMCFERLATHALAYPLFRFSGGVYTSCTRATPSTGAVRPAIDTGPLLSHSQSCPAGSRLSTRDSESLSCSLISAEKRRTQSMRSSQSSGTALRKASPNSSRFLHFIYFIKTLSQERNHR